MPLRLIFQETAHGIYRKQESMHEQLFSLSQTGGKLAIPTENNNSIYFYSFFILNYNNKG